MNAQRPRKPLQRRHIEALVAIGDSQSVHRAARSLGVPQPVLSRLLGEAETLLGARLFERSSHGSVPTAEGERVLPRARFILRTMERLNEAVSGDAPPIRLGCIPRAMHTLLPRLLGRVYPEAEVRVAGDIDIPHPETGLRFEVREGNSVALFEGVQTGELDFAILRGTVGDSSDEWVVERLYDERTVIYCAAGHPEIPDGPVPLARLAPLGWTLPEPGTSSRGSFDTFWTAHGLSPIRPVMETRSFEANLAVVAATRLVSIAPESIVQRHVGFGALRIVKVRRTLPSNPVMLAYNRLAVEDPVLSHFRRQVHEAARMRHGQAKGGTL